MKRVILCPNPYRDGELTVAKHSKEILEAIGFETVAAGDSFNDLGMIRASKAGFLFKSTEAIRAANPDLPAFEEYGDLLAAIKAVL